MEATALPHAVSEKSATPIPVYHYATVLSSLSIIVGLVWDISWHMSIGRDGLLSPPHLAIYLGGVTAGLFSGYRILKVSFAGTASERSMSVRFWGIFYASLGNLFCVWGAIAMLTSAPFDDWWHNTYGLDVTILSPPHTVLLLGMITIQFGAIISVLAAQNNLQYTPDADDSSLKNYNLLFGLSGGFVLTMIYTIASEELSRHEMHATGFYKIASSLFPLFLIAFSVASRSRWGATQAALVYTVFLMLINWILPLFPATPKLGPVLTPVTNFQPFDFPLMLLLPAVAIDVYTVRSNKTNKWIRAIIYSAIFLVIFFPLQWFFAEILMASEGHWFLGTSRWYFGSPPDWEYRYAFPPDNVSTGYELAKGLSVAFALGILSSRMAIAWGGWMSRIAR